jgi:hypothetical protein
MKARFWPADVTEVTLPKEIDRVEIGQRREDENGDPAEPELIVHGSDPGQATVHKGNDPGDAEELITDPEKGVTYYLQR